MKRMQSMCKLLTFILFLANSLLANAFSDSFTGLGIAANAAQMKALGKHSCSGSFVSPSVTVYLTTSFNTDGLGKYTSGNYTASFFVPNASNPPFIFTCNYILDNTKTSKYITGADGRGYSFVYWTPVSNSSQNPGINVIPGLCSTSIRNQIISTSSYTGSTTITLKNIKATHFIDGDFNQSNNPQAVPVQIYCD